MKKILLLLLLSGICQLSMGQFTYYAAARSGLSMREQPSVNAKVIEKIAYGEKLSTLADSNPQVAIVTEGFNGFWWKVSYHNKTGYIVRSYVLPQPPPKAGVKDLKAYFDQVSAAVGKPLVVKRTDPALAEAGESSLTKQLYKNGMEWHHNAGYEYGADVYMLPDFTIEQSFLLVRLLGQYPELIAEKDAFPVTNSSTKNDIGEKAIEVEREKTDGKPGAFKKIKIISTQGAYTEFEIFNVDTQAVIYWSSGV